MRPKPSPQNDGHERIAPLAKLPIFWTLAGKRAIVVGGSDAAAWKVELLQACGADVDLYCESEDLGETMRALIERTALRHHSSSLALWHFLRRVAGARRLRGR